MHKGDFWGLFGIRLGICPGIFPEKNQLSAILFQAPVFFPNALTLFDIFPVWSAISHRKLGKSREHSQTARQEDGHTTKAWSILDSSENEYSRAL